MIIFLVLITGLYVLLMLALLIGWQKIPEFRLKYCPPEVKFSVVIPYRNEADNLPDLIHSLSKLKYPTSHFEVLLVNDASEDNSLKICSDFKQSFLELQISLFENHHASNSPKKDAISTAIKNAQFKYIVTTDADCNVPEHWLQAFNDIISKTGAKLIAGPVAPSGSPEGGVKKPSSNSPQKKEDKNYFQAFEEMDFISLQAAGAGGFGLEKAFMCNGANLCYSRSAFYEVNGFSENDTISSGDDVFLLQKFTEKKWKIAFLKCKEAVVLTKPQPDLATLISQRIRWAAKTPAYKSAFPKLIGLSVLLMNLSLIVGCALVFLNLLSYQPLLVAFLFKFIVDFLLLYMSAEFFGRREILRNYFWGSLFYPFFSTSVVLLSLTRKFEWKGRVSKR